MNSPAHTKPTFAQNICHWPDPKSAEPSVHILRLFIYIECILIFTLNVVNQKVLADELCFIMY